MLDVTCGLERTESQYSSLFEAAGLHLDRVIPTCANDLGAKLCG
jgi:hypothetical protein